MARRKLVTPLTQALEGFDLEPVVQPIDEDVTAIDFRLPVGSEQFGVRAFVIGNEMVTFHLDCAIEVPEERAESVLIWVLRTNAAIPIGTIELDPDDGSLGVRHAVDCAPIPTSALPAVLGAAVSTLAAVWENVIPSLLSAVAGQGEAEDEDDDDADGDDEPSDEEMSASFVGDEEEDYADEASVERLGALLRQSVAETFSEEIADALGGALHNIAGTYLDRLSDRGVEEGRIDVTVKGTEEGAVMTLAVEGMRPLRFRFSPAAVRERMERDAAGLTLFYHASPTHARECLASGFVDEPVLVRGDYTLDPAGVPLNEDAADSIEAVLLTDAPLPADDRGPRSAVLRIDWDPDAPDLGEYERAETGYTETEAWLVALSPRRWHVPAAVLNDAVRSGLATVSEV